MMMRLLPFMFGLMANADIYLQHPMGSNNRLDDENRDRNNGNRLFDSQNNNRGGYNVGNVFFYEGTTVPMQWTAQHTCGNPNNHCEMIIQMMCDQKLRDGTTTKTIPENPVECYNWDCDSDVRYGRHESFTFYKTCKKTERNKGLFVASQNVKGESAIYTRQNPNGARRGYECPEERDYYPYWRPSPWVDVGYFTNDASACAAIVLESGNVKDRFACVIKEQYLYMETIFAGQYLPITQEACEILQFTVANMVDVIDPTTNLPVIDPTTNLPVQEVSTTEPTKIIFPSSWKRVRNSAALKTAIGEPTCSTNTWSRDNHHGNVLGGDFTGFNWTVPNFPHDSCALRIRYNISTLDLPHLRPNNLTTDDIGLTGRYHVGMNFGYNMTEVDETGYYFENNPQVAPFVDYTPLGTNGVAEAFLDTNGDPLKFQLAVNTAQYGRTFEDRSHRFSIKSRPNNVPSAANIFNLGVRGKRGNIVQTYPGTEYSFSPEELQMATGDFVHVQWVGSNTNPNNNAGQGRQGSDRHNIAILADKVYAEAGQPEAAAAKPVHGQFGRSYPGVIADTSFLGFSAKDRESLAILKGINTNGGELSELDDSGTYANFKVMQVTETGFFNYLCTRNNNFSNRSQKGKIEVVSEGTMVVSSLVAFSGASLTAGGATLTVSKGSTAGDRVEFIPLGHKDNSAGFCHPRCGSNYFELPNAPPQDASTNLRIPFETRADGIPVVYYTSQSSISAPDGSWNKLSATCSDGFCTVPANSAGVYVVWNEFSWWVYLLSIIAIIVTLVIVFFMVKRMKGSS